MLGELRDVMIVMARRAGCLDNDVVWDRMDPLDTFRCSEQSQTAAVRVHGARQGNRVIFRTDTNTRWSDGRIPLELVFDFLL
jgi:hypothetical protein